MIVSSSFALDAHDQKDGTCFCIERHVDSTGVEHICQYSTVRTADHASIMAARALRIAENLADTEFENIITGEWRPLQHQTAAQFAARLRARYKDSSGVECARIAKWILDNIDAGNFTETQVRNAFGLTAGQWTTLKAKLTTLRTNYNAALAARGE